MAFNELVSFILFVIVSSIVCSSFSHLVEDPDEAGARFVNEWAIHVDGTVSDAKAITRQLGFIYHRPVHGLAGYHVVKRPEQITGYNRFHHHRLRRHAKVRWVEQQKAKVRRKRDLSFNDKMFKQQWYLLKGARGGFDMNVMSAWNMNYTGRGIVVTILDDGIERTHPDLSRNYDPKASYDINGDDDDPSPRATFDNENKHGTRCAGEVAAVANNGLCNVGVAFNSRIGGVRMLDGDITDSVEGSSLGLRQDHIDIYSGSWGPDDNGKVVDGPGVMAKTAFETGVKTGRRGLGNIFVWASGNGGNSKDSCACDGYAGSIYTLSVSAVSENNKKPWYLEECASTLASTYSSGYNGERQIITTDLHKKCTDKHTGTSASAPLAAGIIALVLEANRDLTWRDVQYITLLTANPTPFIDANWITNGVGRKVSLLYGYGLMDAGKMVYLAPLWRRTPDQHTCTVQKTFNANIYGKNKANVVFTTDGCRKSSKNAKNNSVIFVEHVLLYLNLEFNRRGHLRITLVSPAGTRSVLLPPRPHDTVSGPTKFDRWPLMSVQFWGERAAGQWHLEVENTGPDMNSGKLTTGQFVIYGVDEQPIRLKQPKAATPDWFRRDFRSYVISDQSYETKTEDGRSRKPDGKNDSKKKQCHKECANATACHGSGANQCEACRNFRLVSDGFCVPKCPVGTYAKADQRVCETCHLQCASCRGPGHRNCTGCRRGSAYLADQHLCLALGAHCPETRYLSADGKECITCPSPCDRCESKERCHRCRSDKGVWVLSPTSQCVRACPARYYVSTDRRCLLCPASCSACISGRDDGCTSCPAPRLLLKTNRSAAEGYCVDQCPTGFYLDKKDNKCFRCHESCGSCHGPSNKECNVCRQPLVLHSGVCVDPADLKCKNGQYKKSGQCLPCHPSCERCDGGSAGNCLECRQVTDVYYKGHCQARCPDGLFPHNMTDKYSVHGITTTCVYCHSLCAACRGPTHVHCTRCYAGLLLTANGSCRPRCAPGQFGVTASSGEVVCEACSDSACAICTIDRRCLKCRQGHVLVDGRCRIGGVCPKGHGSLHGRCVPCPDPDCEKCSGNELSECKSCRPNYRLHTSGKCLPPRLCRANEYLDKFSKCRPCHNLCRTCSGPSDQDCTSCRMDACLIFGVCRPCCSSAAAGQAIASPFPCANCTLGPSPTCLPSQAMAVDTQGAPANQVNKDSMGFFGDLPSPMRLLIVLAFMMCALLPVIYFAIFCTLQLRSGEPIFCCLHLRRHTNPRPAGPDYTPLSQNANGSPEKGSVCDDVDGQLEMTERRLGRNNDVVIQTANGFIKDSDESSGVGSSPDKSPDRNDMLLTA